MEHSKWKHLPPPPGFSSTTSKNQSTSDTTTTTTSSASYNSLREKRAWDLAIGPVKQLPMQALMLYMSGGGVQIFSMGIVFMLLISPFKNLAGMNAAFAPFSATGSWTSFPLQKLVYVVCNMVTLAVGLWKCATMGLLPTGTGDWVGFETRAPPPEVLLY